MSVVSINININADDNTDAVVRKVKKNFDDMGKSVDKTQQKIDKMNRSKIQLMMQAYDRVSGVITKVKARVKSVAGKTWHVIVKAKDFASPIIKGVKNTLLGIAAASAVGITLFAGGSIDAYKEFTSTMSKVEAISGATASQMTQLSDKAKELGATTKFTSAQIGEGYQYMSMAGWSAKEMLEGIAGMTSLTAASGEDFAMVSDIVTDGLSAFNLQAKDSNHFADVLAQTAACANTDIEKMGESFKYVGSVAGAMNYSIEDTSLALGLMANASVKSSMAGTSLRRALSNMAAPTDTVTAAMEKYGISITKSNGKSKTLLKVLDNIRSSLGGLSEQEKTAAAAKIFGTQAMAGMLAIVNATDKSYNSLKNSIYNADGAAEEMAETMMDNLEGIQTLFKSAFNNTQIKFGERMEPYLSGLYKWMTAHMPDVENALDDIMDTIDQKVFDLQVRLRKAMGSSEWENADIFGKIHIAWDEIIAKPFGDWWESTGKAKIADAIGNFGNALGTGLHAGIMTLLGFDVSDSLGEGVSIGKSFAKGFADGFDFKEIGNKLLEGLGNIMKNASKLIPGGESADLSSVLSALLLAKIASPVIKLTSSGINLGSTLFSAGTAAGGASLAGSLIGSSAAGTGLLGFGSMTAIKLGAGNLAGTASLGAGALSAIGLGATAGGIAGGAALITGISDYSTYAKARKAGDIEKAEVYSEASDWEFGGVAGGALAGAAIGSFVPVLGTAAGALIGAGIGGIAGIIKGNKVKEEYEAKMQAAQEAAERAQKVFEVTGRDIDDVKFKSNALTKAMNNVEVSTEEFAQMFQEAVVENLSDHFGDITLSMQEIQDIASDIVFDKQAKKVNRFTEAVQEAGDSLSKAQSYNSKLEKANWQIGISTKLSADDKDNYKTTVKEYVKSVKEYLKDQHYEATVALKLLVGNKSEGMTDGLDEMYEKAKKKINKFKKKLSTARKTAMKDGVIDEGEQDELIKLQEKINNTANKFSEAQEDAKFESLKIKYSGAALDATSFANLQEELQANAESLTENYDSALQTSLSNLQLQLESGAINQKTYDELYQQIADGYNENMKNLQDRLETFQLDAIVDAYDGELDGILPDIKGSTSEKLKEAMENALSIKPEPVNWTEDEITEWFGLDKLDTETQTAIGERLRSVAESIPDSIKQALFQNGVNALPFSELLEASGYQKEFSSAGTLYGNSLVNGAKSSIGSSSSILRSSLEDTLLTATASPFSVTANVNVTPNYNVGGSSLTDLFNHGENKNKDGKPTKNAAGSIGSGKRLSWIYEEGPEAIIPLVASRRQRGIALWKRAGELLGVQREMKNAAGSIPGERIIPVAVSDDADSESATFQPVSVGRKGRNRLSTSENGGNIVIHVHMGQNEFKIDGSSTDVLSSVKEHMNEIADEAAGRIAAIVEEIYSNSPVEEGV